MKYPHWKKNGHLIHRDVAKSFYGRAIEEDEVVHHIDGNPRNFSKCNLIIMKKVDHEKLSIYMKNKKDVQYPKFKHWGYGKNKSTKT